MEGRQHRSTTDGDRYGEIWLTKLSSKWEDGRKEQKKEMKLFILKRKAILILWCKQSDIGGLLLKHVDVIDELDGEKVDSKQDERVRDKGESR